VKRPITGRPSAASAARRLAFIVMIAAVLLPACGKKGPPRPPLVRLPARPEPFAARRLGAVAFLQFRIPSANADGTTPADIERVEVYGLTGRPAGNEDFFKRGGLVATVPVRKPAEPAPEPKKSGKGGQTTGRPETWPAPPPRPPGSMENGFDQGDTIVVTETIGQAQLDERAWTAKTPVPGPPAQKLTRPTRYYVAVGVNRKGRKGATSNPRAVILSAPASAPADVTVTYTETALTISWTPPADAQPPAAGVEAAPRPAPGAPPAASGAFNVYEVPPPPAAGGAKVPTPPVGGGQMPVPVNPAPVAGPPLVDSPTVFGKPRCYVVRAVTLFGTESIESEASPVECVTPVDRFAPAAPTSLNAVGSEGAISLIWEANKESDLAGYLVLRAALPGSDFRQLTPDPIRETTFNDATAARGVRYAYVVLAVDASGNRSAQSSRVEEAARQGVGTGN
jgi:hypothetical protein